LQRQRRAKISAAPTARNMKARGKREAKRSASPLVRERTSDPALKARNSRDISAFQALFDRAYRNQGRRASLCPALAPGFHIPRVWRSVSTFWAKQTQVTK
jgi:hypothetical protein